MNFSFSRYPLNKSSKIKNSILCIGNFDGIHLAHKKLIKYVNTTTGSDSDISLLSFYPHPRSVLFPHAEKINLITPLRARIRLLEEEKVDEVLIIRFNKKLSLLTPEEFVKEIIVKYFSPKIIVVGFDWHFGANRSGNSDTLIELSKKFNFKVLVMPEVLSDGEKVGARDIRSKIIEGRMEEVKLLLGNYFTLIGRVVKGDGRGRLLGFPTANTRLFRQQYPKKGVYFSRVFISGSFHDSITNIGTRPTFSKGEGYKVETHILDFNKDIYGQELRVELLDFLRDEKKFNSVEDLKNQISEDIKRRQEFVLPKN